MDARASRSSTSDFLASCFCCWDATAENIARPNDSTGKRLTIPKLSAA